MLGSHAESVKKIFELIKKCYI